MNTNFSIKQRWIIFRFSISRDKYDPEKSVLPTILFINTNHPYFKGGSRKGFMLAFGWWDFSIKLWFVPKKTKLKHSQND